ncbi:MAG: hypothetical protein EBQ75_00670, partial [Actinobacteria bacterium]|nr:hypothetical protein [Actinomycetota bacterium]
QSPAIRLVVEREEERMAHIAASYWDLEAVTATQPQFTATLIAVDGMRIASGKDFQSDGKAKEGVVVIDEARAEQLCSGLAGVQLSVRSVEEKPYRKSPKAPFMTSTLQQEGGNKLRITASEVMRLAQGLYEAGTSPTCEPTQSRSVPKRLVRSATRFARATASHTCRASRVNTSPRSRTPRKHTRRSARRFRCAVRTNSRANYDPTNSPSID